MFALTYQIIGYEEGKCALGEEPTYQPKGHYATLTSICQRFYVFGTQNVIVFLPAAIARRSICAQCS